MYVGHISNAQREKCEKTKSMNKIRMLSDCSLL